MASDEASEESEFLSALNASLESSDHKTFKYEQIECFHGIVCHRRYVLAVLPTHYISINYKSGVSYGLYSQRHIKNHSCFFCSLTKRNIT